MFRYECQDGDYFAGWLPLPCMKNMFSGVLVLEYRTEKVTSYKYQGQCFGKRQGSSSSKIIPKISVMVLVLLPYSSAIKCLPQ